MIEVIAVICGFIIGTCLFFIKLGLEKMFPYV